MPAPFVLVDGLEVPVQVSGHPGLELCNTFAGWNGPPAWDYLIGYEHLATWACAAGLLHPDHASALRAMASAHPGEAGAVLDRAREVRGRLYDVALCRAEPEIFEQFAQDAGVAGASLQLVRDPEIRWTFPQDAGLAAPVLAAIWAATELLVSPAAARVAACPGNGCGWLFLDRSGRRRWCTMSICGNRAKARRFAARRRPGA